MKETLIIDESGTPLIDDLLVVGGVAISGDTGTIEREFARVATANAFPKKGTKFSAAQFERLAEFLATHHVIPIASFSRIDASDRELLHSKFRELEQINADGSVRNPSGYLWMQQVAQTLIPALCASVAADRGPIEFVRVEFDRFTLPTWVRETGEDVLRKWLDVARRVEPLLRQLEARMPGQAHYFATLRANLLFRPEDHELLWKAPERRGRLADAVAALFRKAMAGDDDASRVWAQLASEYRRADAALPSCVGLDLTPRVKELCRRPWPSRLR